MSDPFLGEIRMVGFDFAPSGWAFCNGALQPISQNTVLFNLIGTTYGGDGQQTFALPNLSGRIPVHHGQGPGLSLYDMGQLGGSERVTLTEQQMPSHAHSVAAASAGTRMEAPSGNVLASGEADVYTHDASTPATMSANTVGTTGGNQPHENLQPFLAVNFIISLQGIYPPQN